MVVGGLFEDRMSEQLKKVQLTNSMVLVLQPYNILFYIQVFLWDVPPQWRQMDADIIAVSSVIFFSN